MEEEIKSELGRLLPSMNRLVDKIATLQNGDWPEYFDRNNPDEMFTLNMFIMMGERMSEVVETLRIMNAPVIAEGKLSKNSSGCYELKKQGYVYTSGYGIEFLRVYDDNVSVWVSSRIEHNGNDYYIVSHPDLKLSGLRVNGKYGDKPPDESAAEADETP
ncbi:DUF5348 domain-containing protein [Paenibacillus gorillae]|uniref:DUF5348 domain-containing protein n=1 Tax=Paenibacillus gorillae TaxID=1243662 RepID=UPI0004B8D481|nr:DUF5348 domain-containing protein [Paenibacillus gorillae]